MWIHKNKKNVVACNPLWKEGDRDVSFCRADHNIDGPLFFFPNNILGTSACFVDTDYQVVTVVLVVRPLPLMPAETWPLNVSHGLKWTLLFEWVFTCMRGVKRCFRGTGLLLTDFCWMTFVENELQKNVNWISC